MCGCCVSGVVNVLFTLGSIILLKVKERKRAKKKKKKKNFKEIGNRTTLWKTIPRWGLIPLFQNLAHSILMVAHPQFHLVVVYTLDAPHYTS